MAVIAAESLVDGMDLDEDWCMVHLEFTEKKALDLALSLVAGKRSKISDFSTNKVTCFIPSPAEAHRVQKIPGYI